MKSTFHPLLFATALLCTVPAAAAEWHIVMSNTVWQGSQASTNMVVRKLSGNGVREDLSPALSLVHLRKNDEHVFLNHSDRTYIRQRSGSGPASASERGGIRQETLNGKVAQVHWWTNSAGVQSTWLIAVDHFLQLEATGTQMEQVSTDAIRNLGVGALVGSNQIVAATEQVLNVSLSSHSAGAGVTPRTVKSTLVSIAQTNCSPAEFQIPNGYREITMRTAVTVRPSIFGNRSQGFDGFEGLQKRLNDGGPIIADPILQPAN